MELRVLEYFVVTATEKSMTKAAQRLHITQPTLSIQLRELENEVNTILFERTNRGIMLTQDGEYFFDKAKQILSLVSNTVSNLQSTDDITGILTLGGAETIQNQFLFNIVHSIQKDYPRVQLSFTSANADHTMNNLDTGLIEFAVTMGNVDTRKYNTISLPYTDYWVLITRNDAPLANLSQITNTDLYEEPLIISGQTNADLFIASWMGKPLEEIHIAGYYNLVYNASVMARAGIGSVLTVEGLINTEGTNLVAIPLSPKLDIGCHLLWKKNTALSPIGKLFLKQLQHHIEQYTENR